MTKLSKRAAGALSRLLQTSGRLKDEKKIDKLIEEAGLAVADKRIGAMVSENQVSQPCQCNMRN